jgi:prohibitin 2
MSNSDLNDYLKQFNKGNPNNGGGHKGYGGNMSPFTVVRNLFFGFLTFFAFAILLGSFYTVQPGNRGVLVTFGKVNSTLSYEGLGFKTPFITNVNEVSVRQQTKKFHTEAVSSDKQYVGVDLTIMYQVPEASVIDMFTNYQGNPFEALIQPRITEALKEITVLSTAQGILEKREEIKLKTLEVARLKIGQKLTLVDVVVENITLSPELNAAIEQKMVQEQEAAKAKFTQLKTQIEAETAVIRATGEAKSIRIRGEAIKANPGLINLQIAEKWNGVSPLVVGAGSGSNVLLPLGKRPLNDQAN